MTLRDNSTPVAVVGTGVAGLTAALSLADHQPVVVLTKTDLQLTNTSLAQGGIASAWSKDDSAQSHIEDTLRVGGGVNNNEAVAFLCSQGAAAVKQLIQFGTKFDQEKNGEYRLALEGAHTSPRVLHAGGDATGAEIQRALSEAAIAHPNIEILEHTRLIGLLRGDQGILGIEFIGDDPGVHQLEAQAVVLATGGSGQVYRYTANQPSATAETLILAAQAGAKLSDIEFFQFHPTGLDLPTKANLLISEAIRGEGALLVNQAGEPFMEKYHPLGALASRDVVSRAIQSEAAKTGRVYLDATQLNHEPVDVRFPNIFGRCLALGIDARKEGIPVTPVAHYMMGGIDVDLGGRSAVPGLYAVGEVSRTGVHGASRLASNSLLEGAVFGLEVANTIQADAVHPPACWVNQESKSVPLPQTSGQAVELSKEQLQTLMWDQVGLIREESGLTQAISTFEQSLGTAPDPKDQVAFELYCLKLFGQMMAQSALLRTESRGSHFRQDFPIVDERYSRSVVHQFFQSPAFE